MAGVRNLREVVGSYETKPPTSTAWTRSTRWSGSGIRGSRLRIMFGILAPVAVAFLILLYVGIYYLHRRRQHRHIIMNSEILAQRSHLEAEERARRISSQLRTMEWSRVHQEFPNHFKKKELNDTATAWTGSVTSSSEDSMDASSTKAQERADMEAPQGLDGCNFDVDALIDSNGGTCVGAKMDVSCEKSEEDHDQEALPSLDGQNNDAGGLAAMPIGSDDRLETSISCAGPSLVTESEAPASSDSGLDKPIDDMDRMMGETKKKVTEGVFDLESQFEANTEAELPLNESMEDNASTSSAPCCTYPEKATSVEESTTGTSESSSKAETTVPTEPLLASLGGVEMGVTSCTKAETTSPTEVPVASLGGVEMGATAGSMVAKGNQTIDSSNDEECCHICLTNFEENDVVSVSNNSLCVHFFHKECITSWLMRNDGCPVCRSNYLALDTTGYMRWIASYNGEESVC